MYVLEGDLQFAAIGERYTSVACVPGPAHFVVHPRDGLRPVDEVGVGREWCTDHALAVRQSLKLVVPPAVT